MSVRELMRKPEKTDWYVQLKFMGEFQWKLPQQQIFTFTYPQTSGLKELAKVCEIVTDQCSREWLHTKPFQIFVNIDQ